jgi:hypothetical protein
LQAARETSGPLNKRSRARNHVRAVASDVTPADGQGPDWGECAQGNLASRVLRNGRTDRGEMRGWFARRGAP